MPNESSNLYEVSVYESLTRVSGNRNSDYNIVCTQMDRCHSQVWICSVWRDHVPMLLSRGIFPSTAFLSLPVLPTFAAASAAPQRAVVTESDASPIHPRYPSVTGREQKRSWKKTTPITIKPERLLSSRRREASGA